MLLQRGQHLGDGHELVQRGVGVGGLVGHGLRVAPAAVGGDDQARTGVVDAVGQRLVREATKHRRVDQPQALGGLRPVQLRGDVGQVQRHALAGLHAQALQSDSALGGFQQQQLARDGPGLDRRAAAAVARQVPAVAFEVKRHLVAMPGQHVAVNLVEAGVGAPAFKPAPVRRLVAVEGALPGRKAGGQVGRDSGRAQRVPAGPARAVPGQPCAGRAHSGHEPVDLAPGDVAMERPRVGQRGGALLLPVGAAAQRVVLRQRHRDRRRLVCRLIHSRLSEGPPEQCAASHGRRRPAGQLR